MLWGKQFGRSGRSVILFWFKLASTPSPSAATRRRSPTPRRCSRWMATLWTTLNQLVVSLTYIIAKCFIQIFYFLFDLTICTVSAMFYHMSKFFILSLEEYNTNKYLSLELHEILKHNISNYYFILVEQAAPYCLHY